MFKQKPGTHLLRWKRLPLFLFVCGVVLFVVATPVLGSLIQNSISPDWDVDVPPDSNPVATPNSELLISKEAETWAGAPVAPAGVISYTLIYENISETITQTDVYVREPIPALTRLISGAVSGGDQVEYSWDDGATWTATLPVTTTPVTHIRWYDAQVSTTTQVTVGFAVQVTTTLPPGAIIQNVAHISSTQIALYPGGWIPSNPVEVQTVDLWVEKSAHQPTVWAGDLAYYTISYGNRGSGDVAGVQITDIIPISATYSAESIWGPGADDSGEPTLVWDVMTVTADSGVQQVGYAVVLNSDIVSGTVIANTASISSAYGVQTSDPATVTVATAADLTIAKSDWPDPVVAGTILTYTLNYVNDGPSDAQGVFITDTLPLDVVYGGEVSVTPSLFGPTQTTPPNGRLTWYTPTLAAGMGGAIVFTVTVDPGAGSSLTNDAIIASSTPELDASNNIVAAYTTVIRETDLGIAKIGQPDPVVAGTALTYTLVITNYGPSDSTGARLFDILPGDVSFNSAASSTDCAELAPDTITCDVDGVAVGDSTTLRIVVDTASSLAEGANLTNWAMVIGSETDPNSKNDGVTIDTMIGRVVNLVISKSDFPDPVIAATALTYTLNIANYGPSDAANVRLSDVLPDDVTFDATASSLGCIELVSGTVTCKVSSVAAYDETPVNIVVIPDSSLAEGTILTNWGFVVSDETDSEPGNNGISENTRVIRRTDLAILKRDCIDPAIAGATLTYTLVYTNNGPLDAPGVTIVDTLPDSVVYGGVVTQSASLGDPDQIGSELDWDIPMLTAGAGGSIFFTVTVAPGASGIITNSANLVSNNIPDHHSGNNDASESTTIIKRADLAVDKTSSPDPVIAGEVLTYTLVYTNSGPSDAQGIIITDTLPVHVAYGGVVTRSATLGDPIQTGQALVWRTPTLAVGVSGNIVFTTTVGMDVRGIITNRVIITSAIPDPNLSNNDTDALTLVNPALTITKTMVDLNGAPLYPGDEIEYRVVARNIGSVHSQTCVTVTDPMPSNVALIAGSMTCTPGAICGGSRSGRNEARVDGFGPADDGGKAVARIERLDPGDILTLTFRAMVINGASSIGENVAVVESDIQSELESDPVGGPLEPGLVIAKSAVDVNGASLETGDTVEYQIVVTNTSDTFAQTNVTISDTVPANTTLAASSVACSSGANCGDANAGGMITAASDSLAPGDVLTLTFQVTLNGDASSIGGNVARVKSDTQNEQRTRTVYPPGARWEHIYLPLVTRGYR
jgi:uncharacterized repeat protein (TIGR01451 family)